MTIILCDFFVKKELRALQAFFSEHDICMAVRKVQDGLGQPLRGSKFPATQLFKLRLTGRAAARILILVEITNDYHIPLMLRLKKDKLVGKNMAVENPHFAQLLDRYLDLAFLEISQNKFKKMDF